MGCCDRDTEAAPPPTDRRQRRVLWAVLIINLLIFGGEFGAGLLGRSTALQGDSLDSLGDALVYVVSLAVVGRSLQARARAGLLKGVVQLFFAGAVLAEVVHKLVVGPEPIPAVMAIAGALALVANGTCLLLLRPFRDHDINMKSVWLCSINDAASNGGLLVTTALIAVTGWLWLDLVFGAALAALFCRTGWQVVAAARHDLARPADHRVTHGR